jgi:hypothetical protein
MNVILPWYRVPEVWLMWVLLVGIVIGSFALLATALRHPDTLQTAPHAIASPLPPSTATRPADD